jgi:glycosyltransferase involved in cell wall biosynthesis
VRVWYFYGQALPSLRAAPIQILHTARALCDLGVEVTLFPGPLHAPGASILEAYGLRHHPQLSIRACASRADKARALLSAHHERPDALIVRDNPGLAVLALLGPLAPPFVIEAHQLAFTDDPEVLAAILRGGHAPGNLHRAFSREARLVKRAAGLVFLTRGLKDAMDALYQPTAPALVLPSGTSVPAGPATAPAARDIDILSAGKLVARKGVTDLIRAMRHLDGLRLVFLGDPALRERDDDIDVIALARDEGVADRVSFAGVVAPSEMASWWRRARVGVCPLPSGQSLVAERFTSPLKIMEMMAHEVPLVATDVASVREILVHDDTALLARPNDPASLAACIRSLHEDSRLAARLTDRAKEVARGRSWAWRAQTLHGFLKTL